jgi:dihydrodipicolinate synthase/N-acetylneuraminate lyase
MVGFCDAAGDLERTIRLIELVASRFNIYSASDCTAYDVVAAGGAGVLSVAANIVPVTMRMMCQAAAYGDAREAAALDASLIPLYDYLSAEADPIPAKFLAGEMGLMRPNVRPPLATSSELERRFTKESGVHAGSVFFPTRRRAKTDTSNVTRETRN